MVRARRGERFDIVFVNSILSIPSVLVFKWLFGSGTIQFDLMGILSEERFPGEPEELLDPSNQEDTLGHRTFPSFQG